MNPTSTYAFYGSLRRGMDNYAIYAAGLQYLYSARLTGFKLYSRGEYPCVVETGNRTDSTLVEVFKILNAETEEGIHQLELDEGYYLKNVQIQGNSVGIYLFKSAENYQEVLSGDWVDFFRKRDKL